MNPAKRAFAPTLLCVLASSGCATGSPPSLPLADGNAPSLYYFDGRVVDIDADLTDRYGCRRMPVMFCEKTGRISSARCQCR